MDKNQWTVIGLLIFLLGLEVIRSTQVKSFFSGLSTNFQGALAASGTGVAAPAPGNSSPYSGLGLTVPAQNNIKTTTSTSSAPTSYPASKAKVS